MKDVSQNRRHNEQKARILFLLKKTDKYLYVTDIAKKLNITVSNAARQVSKLNRQRYIFRRKQRFGTHKGEYEYRFLRRQGIRVCKELWIRTKMREINPEVPLNLKKQTPVALAKLRQELELQYNQWLRTSES